MGSLLNDSQLRPPDMGVERRAEELHVSSVVCRALQDPGRATPRLARSTGNCTNMYVNFAHHDSRCGQISISHTADRANYIVLAGGEQL